MKNAQRVLAKIDVLSCEVKLDHKSGRQAMDKEGNLFWSVDVEEKVFNEKHNKETLAIVTYKTLQNLDLGTHVVELKMTNMGQGSGDFIKVNTFYTIIRSVNMKATLGEVFHLDGVIPPSKRKNIKESASAIQ